MPPVPTIGRIVHYCLDYSDADEINRLRGHGRAMIGVHRGEGSGSQVHVGEDVRAGETYPMIITKVFGTDPYSFVSGQVFLDGNDTFWATSVQVGTGHRRFSWPVVERPAP